jgi:aminoglycoside phosphotransferase (APT) family kinase protein
MFVKDQPVICGVLDWELSTIGHPLSDLANLLLPFYLKQDFGELHALLPDRSNGFPSKEELIQYYCQQQNIPYPIPRWGFCIAFAFFRVRCICGFLYDTYIRSIFFQLYFS